MSGLPTLAARPLAGLAFLLCVVGFLYVQSCQRARVAAAEFGKWINNDGRPMRGLIRRRAAEAALYRGQS